MSWKQWMALFALFLVYLMFGGIVFMALESPAEELRVEEFNDLRALIYDELIACPGNQTLEQRESLWISVAQTVNQPLLIRANESFPHPVRKWGLYNAVFVAVTAVSTIGYGHMSPTTPNGKLFCIVFSLFGIPLNGILFATLGEYFSAQLISRLKKRRSSQQDQQCCSSFLAVLMNVILSLIPGTIIFLAIPAGFFTYLEGWTYVDSFYYAFISLTTIGFGDLVAGTQDIGRGTWIYRLGILVWIFFGLAYLIMVVNIITKGMRSKPVRHALDKNLSKRLDTIRRRGLAKDALLLRRLVNQLRVLKVKPVYSNSYKIRRVESHPAVFNPDDEQQFGGLTNKGRLEGFCSDTALTGIDMEATFRSTESEEKIDPVHLLTRLADALCDEHLDANQTDDEDDDLTPGTPPASLEHSVESRGSTRSTRSYRRALDRAILSSAEASSDGQRKTSGPASDMGGAFSKPMSVLQDHVLGRRSFKHHHRFRRMSEQVEPLRYPLNGRDSTRSHGRVIMAYDQAARRDSSGLGKRPLTVERSLSETQSPVVPVRFNWDSPAKPDENTAAAKSKVSVTDFCDMLQRVHISSRKNSGTPV